MTEKTIISSFARSDDELLTTTNPNYSQGVLVNPASNPDVILADTTPGTTVLTDQQQVTVELNHDSNTISTPTFQLGVTLSKTIVKRSGDVLSVGDTGGSGNSIILKYSSTLDNWVLLNPQSDTENYPFLSAALAGGDEIGTFVNTFQYFAVTGLGGATYEVVAGGTGTPDGGSFIDKTDGSGFQLQLLIKDVIDVDQFGAVGGVADDAAQFQNAINALQQGYTLTGSQSDYFIGTNLTITSKPDTTIDFTKTQITIDPTTVTHLFDIFTSENLTIRNGTFDGKVDEDSVNNPILCRIQDCPRFNLLNNYILDFSTGVISNFGALNNDRALISENTFEGTVATIISGTNAGTLAFGFGSSSEWRVLGNIVHQCFFLALSPDSENWIISNNHCTDTFDSPIHTRGGGHIIDSNVIINGGKDGIKILASSGVGIPNEQCIISNNFVDKVGFFEPSGGVCISSENDNILITGNVCRVADPATVMPATVNGIVIEGSKCIVEGNIIECDSTNDSNGINIQSGIATDKNHVSGNTIIGGNIAITAEQKTTNTLNDLFVNGNQIIDSSIGVFLTTADKTLFNNFICSNNSITRTGVGVLFSGGGDGAVNAVIRDNHIAGNTGTAFDLNGLIADSLLIGNTSDGTESSFLGGSNLVSVFNNLAAQFPVEDILVGVSDTVSIANDSVATFTTSFTSFMIEVTMDSKTEFSGSIAMETAGTNFTEKMYGGANLISSTAVLTGTTGVIGDLTLSANAGTIYIENREGNTRSIRYRLFGQ